MVTTHLGTKCGMFAMMVLLSAASCIHARADFVSDIVLSIDVWAGSSHATYVVPFSGANYDATQRVVTWARTTSTPLIDPNTSMTVATMRNASLSIRHYPPRILIAGQITAGAQNAVVLIRSGWLQYPPIFAGDGGGRVSVSLGVADLNNNGAAVDAIGEEGAGIYLAESNEFVPAGVEFTELINAIEVGAGGTATVFQNDPPQGTRQLDYDVWGASVELEYTLTAMDRASYNTQFNIEGPTFPTGDLNCDGVVNNFDIDPFTLALTDEAGFHATYPTCEIMNADINGDNAIDNFDIDAFLELL
ncbi:MAG: hypothetical protein JNG88_06320 [Phycisphaerales bacterium]|nr:hypothetical protein [Phycisphaerales bacterium]